jgi:DNA-binding GntR family transcriptional regulator
MTDTTSVTDRAYHVLRADLIACRLRPGERLTISQLQTEHALSQAAVREALSRLTAEGLVEIERNRGFRAAPVSATGFRDLTNACLTVEIPCLRSSIEHGNTEWELNLVATYHRALHTLELVANGKEDVEAYARMRQVFYEALLGACTNPWLLWSWRLLYAQNMRYRHLYMPLAQYELEINPDHASIMQAVLARDVERAVALSLANYEKISDFIEAKILENH